MIDSVTERMERISQDIEDDCTVCVVAMVMGPPYTYERVLEDCKKYPRADDEGHGLPWWKKYLEDEGYEIELKPLKDLRQFSDFSSMPDGARAILVFQIPHMQMGHVVAIDRFGVIDPQNHPAEYTSVGNFVEIFKMEGWRLYTAHYWLVQKRKNP